MNQLTTPLLELLKDVGRYVAETLSGEKLSEKASARRQVLIQRLKMYLPDTFPSSTPPPYLDMTATLTKGLSHLPDGNEYVGADKQVVEEEYEECPEPHGRLTSYPIPLPTSTAAVTPQREGSPVPQISYNELRTTSPKSGPLQRKERVFFMDQFRRYWVGIGDQWLFFYGSDKDSKPCSLMDLTGFRARPEPNVIKDQKKKKERECCFEIICPGKKTTQVQLIARTAKDMEQWIAAITLAGRIISPQSESPALRNRQLPSIPDSRDSGASEQYDDIEGLGITQQQKPVPPTQVEEEEIYHDISVVSGGESDRESLYDDVGSYPNSVYYNMGKDKSDQRPPSFITELTKRPQPPIPQELEEEDIYDDISGHEEPAPAVTKPPAPACKTKIQGLALHLEATLGRGGKRAMLIQDRSIPMPLPSEELYELVDSPQPANNIRVRPPLPIKPNLVR